MDTLSCREDLRTSFCRTAGAGVVAVFLLGSDLAIQASEPDISVVTRGQMVRAAKVLAPEARDPRYFLLLIASDSYADPSWAPLHTPVNDAVAVRDTLIGRYLFETNDVRQFFNGQATRENILQAFEGLRREVKGEDSIIVYYAGHGKVDAGSGFWIPYDGLPDKPHTWVSHDDIRSRLRALDGAKHVLLISDSCFSGEFVRGGGADPTSAMSRDLRAAYKRVSRRVLTSGGIEEVKDAGVSGDHSVFAHFLLRALRENKSRFSAFSSPDLFGYIKSGVAGNPLGKQQTPFYAFIRDTGGAVDGELVLMMREGLYSTSELTAAPPPGGEPVPGPDSLPPADPKPPHTNSIRFSNPTEGFLSITGKKYDLATQPVVHLGVGAYPFSLELPAQRPIFGRLTVNTVNDETELATFGDSDGIFIRNTHIRSCLEGKPVIYSVNYTGSEGTFKAITYVLTLHKIQ